MRREWIEIHPLQFHGFPVTSPSMRREWIEISESTASIPCAVSPSMRREWIEITTCADVCGWKSVSLHAEGVD